VIAVHCQLAVLHYGTMLLGCYVMNVVMHCCEDTLNDNTMLMSELEIDTLLKLVFHDSEAVKHLLLGCRAHFCQLFL